MSSKWLRTHPFALALSHDVDRVHKSWSHVLYYAGQGALRLKAGQVRRQVASGWARLRSTEPYWNFPRVVDFEEKMGVRSTFFFLDEHGRVDLCRPRTLVLYCGRYSFDQPRIQQIIRDLDAGGWEVGLHGSYNSYLDLELLGREKARLEGILGHPVCGVRQHYLRLEKPTTWRIQAELGFVYDSSLGYTDRVGFSSGSSLPFRPSDPVTHQPLGVLQIPMTIMDGPLLAAAEPWSEVTRCLDAAEREGGVVTLDWHQSLCNPWEPCQYWEMYQRIVEEGRRRGAWLGPLRDVERAWLAYESGESPPGGRPAASGGSDL